MEGDFCLNNADGDGVWLHTTCAPVLGPDGETCKVVVIGSDLRAQKAEALHNEGYVQATQRSQGGVELTPEGEILTANEIFLDALGLDLFDLLGEHDSILLPEGGADSPEYRALRAALEGGEPRAGPLAQAAAIEEVSVEPRLRRVS